MYDLPRESKNWNPQDSANFVSKLFFSYETPTFITAYKRFLTEKDLHDTRPCDRAEPVQMWLQKYWNKSNKKGKKQKGRFMRTVVWSTLGRILPLLPIAISEELFKLGQAIVLGQLLRYYAGQISESAAYGLSVLLALCCFLQGLTHHNFFYHLQAIGMRVRVACCAMVYEKLMQISSADYVETSTGRAVNLLSNDVIRFDYLFLFAPYFVIAPFQLLIVTAFSWYVIGWYCVPGVALLVLFAIVYALTPRAYRYLRKKTALLTDQRLLHMSELLNAIKVVKASCWEDMFMKVIARVRRREIKCVLWARLLECLPSSLATCAVKLVMFLIILAYLFTNDYMPSSSQVYQVLTAISPTRITILVLLPMAIRLSAESWISSRRIEEILKLENKFSIAHSAAEEVGTVYHDALEEQKSDEPIVMKDLTLSWHKVGVGLSALEDISVSVKKGDLVAIIGPVGCGKSSLLYGILGELFQQRGTVQSNGVISYSSQDPWLFNGTVRQNVLFGSSYDKNRLKEVYSVTCLEQDLKTISNGDLHFLGDKGIGLSGGQRARVSLARAVYRKADVYLLDEPLGAVDVKTGERIFASCITGYLKEKTVLLATHQVQFLPYCDWIVIINKGKIVTQGTYDALKDGGIDFSSYVKEEEPVTTEELPTAEKRELPRTRTRGRTISDYNESSGNLDYVSQPQETMSRGSVGFSVYAQYIHAGARSWFIAIFVFLVLCGTVVLFVLTDWWLSEWLSAADNYNKTLNGSEGFNNKPYLIGFTGLTAGSLVSSVLRCVMYVVVVTNSARILHNKMFHKILKTSLYFFSVNPIGIILNRFSRDVGAMDEIIPQMMQDALECGTIVLGLLVYIAVVNPYTLIVIIPYIAAALFLRTVYLKCAQDVKRLDAVTRSPVFAHLNNTLLGLPIIRAFGMQERLIEEFHDHLDHNTKAFNMFLTTQKWFQLRLEIVSSLFVLLSSIIFVGLGKHISPSTTGLSLSYAVTMLGLFQWSVRQSAEMASYMTSVERVLEYSQLTEEPEPKTPIEVPEGWPSTATLELKDVSFQYGPETEKVLRNISFSVKRGEKVGLAGRTGAGKSSIFNAILRLGTTTGTILLDGIDTKMITLRQLRSHISLIPQEPVLFTATVRENLDPFDNHTDADIWDALEKVEMKEEIKRNPLALQMMVTEGGGSLSVGQRQLLCMARALLQKCSMILVDEATANVDRETDALIQKMIRRNFAKCTVLTVAHRLDTIIDSDVVLVFHKGQLVERDSPTNLLRDSGSRFYSLASEQGSAELSRLTHLARLAVKRREEK